MVEGAAGGSGGGRRRGGTPDRDNYDSQACFMTTVLSLRLSNIIVLGGERLGRRKEGKGGRIFPFQGGARTKNVPKTDTSHSTWPLVLAT
jgi:hypothetical protein